MDALVDFTGGISESFNLRREETLPADLFGIMQTSFNVGSLLGTGIRVRNISTGASCRVRASFTFDSENGSHAKILSE